MSNRYAVILAAGKGTRMKSKLYKVLHPVCEKPMVQHVVDQVKSVGFSNIVTIVGFGADEVQAELGKDISYVIQHEQLGTGHAVLQASTLLAGKEGVTLVLCGDTPLITAKTLNELLAYHEKEKASVTILTAHLDEPAGYGRIVKDLDGTVRKIIEHKDASSEEREIKEINTGTYCFDNKLLFESLKKVNNNNAQGEYYLPDVIEILQKSNGKVVAYQTEQFEETVGVNDRIALAEAEAIMRNRINRYWMKEGVTIVDPTNTYISADAKIGRDTVVYPGTMISGKTFIGEECQIGPHTELKNSSIGNKSSVKQSVVHDSIIGDSVAIGPFSHIRPQSSIGNDVKIGNFVEVKKSTIGNNSKASHLSYVGDAEIGNDVNLGCGSITVNYDGTDKHITKVEDGAFVGCNSNLVAPVTVGKNAYVAAGSTITENVPEAALSIARSRQVNKDNYQEKKSEKKD